MHRHIWRYSYVTIVYNIIATDSQVSLRQRPISIISVVNGCRDQGHKRPIIIDARCNGRWAVNVAMHCDVDMWHSAAMRIKVAMLCNVSLRGPLREKRVLRASAFAGPGQSRTEFWEEFWGRPPGKFAQNFGRIFGKFSGDCGLTIKEEAPMRCTGADVWKLVRRSASRWLTPGPAIAGPGCP